MYASTIRQRGVACFLRQIDDNSGNVLFSNCERYFLNQVIHDPRLDYQPWIDDRLAQLAHLTLLMPYYAYTMHEHGHSSVVHGNRCNDPDDLYDRLRPIVMAIMVAALLIALIFTDRG